MTEKPLADRIADCERRLADGAEWLEGKVLAGEDTSTIRKIHVDLQRKLDGLRKRLNAQDADRTEAARLRQTAAAAVAATAAMATIAAKMAALVPPPTAAAAALPPPTTTTTRRTE